MDLKSVNENAIIEQLVEWISTDSTSGNESAFLIKLEEHFSSLGFKCQRQYVEQNRWNLFCIYQPDPSTLTPPRLYFTTHVDCVPPFIPPKCVQTGEGTVIFGRGACDTKGGIVAMTQSAKILIDEGFTELGFLFVVGEEVDHCGAKFVASHASDEDFALLLSRVEQWILCEPTVNRVTQAQKGMLKLSVDTHGVACHSAYPQRGVSAIEKLLDLLQQWRTMPLPEDEVLGPTTMNIGRISGGVAANVVPAAASAEILIRAVSPVDELLKAFQEKVEGPIVVNVPTKNDPVFFDPPQGVETANVAFNTDAPFLSKLGSIWLVGPGDIEVAHSDQESISLKSLVEGIELYVKLGRCVFTRN